VRRLALLSGFLACLAATLSPALRADEIEIRAAQLKAVEDGLALDADFDFDLTPRLADVVSNGVPLYFRVEFELTRRRWYWFDEQTASRSLQLRLSYQPLLRQYRLSSGPLQQSFATLDEALNVIKRVRNWLVVDRTVSFSKTDYEVGVRMRLDRTLLPKPFQLSALTSRELHLESSWTRFTVHSPRQLPAPVESREPTGNADK
jgi:uncharacterized protein DUF4390